MFKHYLTIASPLDEFETRNLFRFNTIMNSNLIYLYLFSFIVEVLPKIIILYNFSMVILTIVSIFCSLIGMQGIYSLVILSIHNYVTSEHYDWSILNMTSNGGPSDNGFTNNNNNNSSGGNGGGNPGWHPYEFERKENGRLHRMNMQDPSIGYDHAGNIPPATNKQVGVLMQYRFDHYVRPLGFNQ